MSAPEYSIIRRGDKFWICYRTANSDDGPYDTREEAEEWVKIIWEMED